MLSQFGSIFLGDPRHHRLVSSSPPPSASLPFSHGPQPISPEMALQLRIRWLEALVMGVNEDKQSKENDKGGDKSNRKDKRSSKVVRTTRPNENGEDSTGRNEQDDVDDTEELEEVEENTLMRQAEEIQRKLDHLVSQNEDYSRFVQNYDRNAHLFTPNYAFLTQNPSTSPHYSVLPSSTLDALLQEMQPEIRAADRTLQQIAELTNSKANPGHSSISGSSNTVNVLDAGKLEDYEPLLPRLHEVIRRQREDERRVELLETKVMELVAGYSQKIGMMSELFVDWNSVLDDAERTITRLEKEKAERNQMGLP